MKKISYFQVPEKHKVIYEKLVEGISKPKEQRVEISDVVTDYSQSIIGKDILYQINENNIGVGRIGSISFTTQDQIAIIKIRFSCPIEWFDKDRNEYKSFLLTAITVTLDKEERLAITQYSDRKY